MAPALNLSIAEPSAAQQAKTEMTRMQKGLVDSSFEEGHYEAGIDVLNELRTPTLTPSRSHVRQLLYIALCPSQDKETAKATHDSGPPTKFSSAKSGSSALTPSHSAKEAALASLWGFTRHNSPVALMRALPSYSEPGDVNRGDAEDEAKNDESAEGDSFLAGEARRFQQCKDCWQILKQGFIPPVMDGSGVSPASPGKHRRGHVQMDCAPHNHSSPLCAVGSDAWPILEWLLRLFERDEEATERQEKVRYSPLLLSQIPSTRSETGAKWAANAPLDVALYSLKQEVPRLRQMGGRLLALLINLTSTPLFDLPLFVNLLVSHLPSDLLALGELMTLLGSSSTAIRFKLALCQRYLSYAPAKRRKAAARAQPRAQPRPTRRKRGDATQADTVTSASSIETLGLQNNKTAISRNPLPPASEILHLLAPQTDSSPTADIMKYSLLLTYGTIQQEAGVDDKSQDWLGLIRDGSVAQAVEEAFGSRSAKEKDERSEGMRKALLRRVTLWQ